jgi:hypothetical protein
MFYNGKQLDPGQLVAMPGGIPVQILDILLQ